MYIFVQDLQLHVKHVVEMGANMLGSFHAGPRLVCAQITPRMCSGILIIRVKLPTLSSPRNCSMETQKSSLLWILDNFEISNFHFHEINGVHSFVLCPLNNNQYLVWTIALVSNKVYKRQALFSYLITSKYFLPLFFSSSLFRFGLFHCCD